MRCHPTTTKKTKRRNTRKRRKNSLAVFPQLSLQGYLQISRCTRSQSRAEFKMSRHLQKRKVNLRKRPLMRISSWLTQAIGSLLADPRSSNLRQLTSNQTNTKTNSTKTRAVSIVSQRAIARRASQSILLLLPRISRLNKLYPKLKILEWSCHGPSPIARRS